MCKCHTAPDPALPWRPPLPDCCSAASERLGLDPLWWPPGLWGSGTVRLFHTSSLQQQRVRAATQGQGPSYRGSGPGGVSCPAMLGWGWHSLLPPGHWTQDTGHRGTPSPSGLLLQLLLPPLLAPPSCSCQGDSNCSRWPTVAISMNEK